MIALVNGNAWRVVRVPAGHPFLLDGTGTPRLGTANPSTRTVAVDSGVRPPLLDRVVLHEVAHAIAMEHGQDSEQLARFVEEHALEAVQLASDMLGRPVCISGHCSNHVV